MANSIQQTQHIRSTTFYKVRKIIIAVLFFAVLLIGVFLALLPFLYMISNSLKSYAETVTRVSSNVFAKEFWPKWGEFHWENFQIVWVEDNFAKYFLNSVTIALTTLTGTLTFSSLAAYAFAKMKFKGKDFIFGMLLFTLMIPETVHLIPNFLTITALGWYNRLAALTIPFMGSAFNIFLLRTFFIQVPNSVIESARIDGCSNFRIFRTIALPLTRAPLFTVGFLAFNMSWNALMWPMVVTNDNTWRPITVGLSKFITEAGPETQLRMAGAIISLLPILVIYIIAQKQITEAIAKTGIKG